MISTPVRFNVRPRAVGPDGVVLPMARHMAFLYDSAQPYEVRLYDPVSAGDLPFARDLLDAALCDGRAGDGDVQLHLAFQHSTSWLFLERAGASPLAFNPKTAAAFLDETYAIVAAGAEGGHLHVPDDPGELLGRAA
jgi:hypothetical protein